MRIFLMLAEDGSEEPWAGYSGSAMQEAAAVLFQQQIFSFSFGFWLFFFIAENNTENQPGLQLPGACILSPFWLTGAFLASASMCSLS